jgi:hypothetical protein
VVLVGLLLTTGLVFGAYKASPPEYNARALVLLLPPRADVGKGGNPFLLLSGLEQPAGILAAYFSSAPARSDVEAISPTAEYEVGIDDSTRGPVIAIDVTDESPADTLKVLGYLLEQIPAELARLQQEVDTRGDAVVGSMSLTVDRVAEPDIRGTIRLMIAALVVGMVGTGFAAVALDGFLLRRKQRSGSLEEDAVDSDSSEDPVIGWDDRLPAKIGTAEPILEEAVSPVEPDDAQGQGESDRPTSEQSVNGTPKHRPDDGGPKARKDGSSDRADVDVDDEASASQSSAWNW